MKDARQNDLFDFRDPLAAGTFGTGANPADDPNGANRCGSKFGSYFAERAENAAIANERRRQMAGAPSENAPALSDHPTVVRTRQRSEGSELGMTLDDAIGFAIIVLRKLSTSDGNGSAAGAGRDGAEGASAAITGGGRPGDGIGCRAHQTRTTETVRCGSGQ